MKSLLVDVLREAQGDASAEEPGKPAEASATDSAVAPEPAPALPESLNLLETGQFDAGETASEPAEEYVEPEPESPADEEHEPSATSEQGRLGVTSILVSRGARLTDGPPAVTRIGRMAPVICLVAIAGVASGYLVLNKVTGGSLNDDLDEISGIVRDDDRRNWLDDTVADTNVFDRVAPAVPNVEQPDPPRPETSGATAAAAPARTVGSASGQPAATGVSRDAIADVEDRAYRHVVAAYAHYQAGDHADAEREYRLALSIEPHHRDALLGIAAVYQRSGRLAEAIGAYERVLKTSPGNTVAASALLSIRSSESGWDSESDLKLLLQRFPDADHLHFALGSVFIGERRWAEARQAFISANQLDPTNAAYSYNLAVSCENLGDIECARTYYRAALANAGSESTLDRGAVESHLDRLAAHVGEGS